MALSREQLEDLESEVRHALESHRPRNRYYVPHDRMRQYIEAKAWGVLEFNRPVPQIEVLYHGVIFAHTCEECPADSPPLHALC